MDVLALRLAQCLGAWLGTEVAETERINCHHNYTEREEHAGTMVWLTRKGAIRADVGMKALIPGSMGTASYVVEGLGAADLDERMTGIVCRPAGHRAAPAAAGAEREGHIARHVPV